MALDMIGQVTGMDLFLVERQGRRAVEETARSYQGSIDKWKAHSNDLKLKLNVEKCHSAGRTAQYMLLKKLMAEGNTTAHLEMTRMLFSDGTGLNYSQLTYYEAYNAKARELNVPVHKITPI